MVRLHQITERLQAVTHTLVAVGRLTALQALCKGKIQDKLDHTARVSCLMDKASELEAFLLNHYQVGRAQVEWPEWILAEITEPVTCGNAGDDAIGGLIERLSGRASATAACVEEEAATTPLLGAVVRVTHALGHFLPEAGEAPVLELAEVKPRRPESPRQTLRGPFTVDIDPAFVPGPSLMETRTPAFGNSVVEAVPFFWNLAAREAMASDLCSLSLIEYDGLPLAFYRDFAKQALEEAGHAKYLLNTALSQLPSLTNALSEGRPVRDSATSFLETGSGFPIPRERNLYEAIWNATLAERLILLHHDTEAPAVATMKRHIESAYCQANPDIAAGFEIVRRDEISHAHIGHTWLQYLFPDRTDLEDAIRSARLMRGLLLSVAFTHYQGGNLGEVVEQVLSLERKEA